MGDRDALSTNYPVQESCSYTIGYYFGKMLKALLFVAFIAFVLLYK